MPTQFTLPHGNEVPSPASAELGTLLDERDGMPRINRVINDSVAEIAGLKAGDQIVRAAGLEMRKTEDLMGVVARQPPGSRRARKN
jgi:C-terminal processing protease CtpA/Prc